MSTESNLNLVKTVVAPKAKIIKKKAEPKGPPQTVEAAAREVAESIGGDVNKTESELLAKLLKRSSDAATDVSINDLISGMQIDGKARTDQPKSKSQFVRKSIGENQQRHQRSGEAGRSDDSLQRERFQRRAPRVADPGNM